MTGSTSYPRDHPRHFSLRLPKITHHLSQTSINPLHAELNPICHLLILLGDLTFMGPCIVSIFQYISNKMQRYTVYLYLETALHVSGDATHSTLKPVPTLP